MKSKLPLRRCAALTVAIVSLSLIATPTNAADGIISNKDVADLHAAATDSEQFTPIPAEGLAARGNDTRAIAQGGCTEPDSKGVSACVQMKPSITARFPSDPSARAIQPIPTWCADNFGLGLYVTRAQGCESFDVQITKNVVQNGVHRVVGTADFASYSYLYTSFSLPTFGHQFGLALASVTGDVSGVFVNASSECAGSCTHLQGVIPAIPVTTSGWQAAESFSSPTSTASDNITYLATRWRIGVTVSGGTVVTPPAYTGYIDARCDNAIGNRSPGCVIYYAPGLVTFSSSSTPALASHISQAIASGLPGGSPADPLHRTTNASVQQLNRSIACAGAPTSSTLGCDEYPFASTYEGAASGGTARSFPGCGFADPSATGPIGFSRCMIPRSQNSSQGGTLSFTYSNQRILDADPIYIVLN